MKSILILTFILIFSPFSYGCFGQLASSMSQGISQKYNLEKERSNSLMKQAEQRVKVAKDCREQLQKTIIEFRSEKLKQERVIRKQPVNIEKAEIEYEQAVLELKSECENTANKEFPGRKEQHYSVPIGDPTAIASFEQSVNKEWKIIYTNCWRGIHQGGGDNARQKQVQLLARKLKNAIAEIQEEVNFAKEKLKELHAQTTMLQKTINQNCQDAKDLQDYNERIIADIHAKGQSAASKTQSMSTLGAVMSCLSGAAGGLGGGNGSNSSL